MSDKGVCRTAPATPGLVYITGFNKYFFCIGIQATDFLALMKLPTLKKNMSDHLLPISPNVNNYCFSSLNI